MSTGPVVLYGAYILLIAKYYKSAHVCDMSLCQVFEDEANMNKLEDVQVGDFGRVAEVTITKDDCLLMKVVLILAVSVITSDGSLLKLKPKTVVLRKIIWNKSCCFRCNELCCLFRCKVSLTCKVTSEDK